MKSVLKKIRKPDFMGRLRKVYGRKGIRISGAQPLKEEQPGKSLPGK